MSLEAEPSKLSSRLDSFDEEEIQQVFAMFDEDKNGVISVQEVRNYMRKLRFNLSEEETNNLMKTVDLNKDGTVDFEEFFTLYQTILSAGKETELNSKSDSKDIEDEDDVLQAFRVFDSNQDGYITAPELQAVFRQVGLAEGKNLKACQRMIENVTKDGSGRVDLKQFRQLMANKIPPN